MFRCAAVCRPAAAVERIIKPLMAKLRGELPGETLATTGVATFYWARGGGVVRCWAVGGRHRSSPACMPCATDPYVDLILDLLYTAHACLTVHLIACRSSCAIAAMSHRCFVEAGTRNLSRSIEDSLTWHLVLLGSTVGGLRPQYAAPLVPTLEGLVDDTLKV